MKFTVFDAYSNMTCIREERTLLIFGLQPALTLLCVFLNPESQSGADCMSFPSLTVDGVGGQSLVHIHIQQRSQCISHSQQLINASLGWRTLACTNVGCLSKLQNNLGWIHSIFTTYHIVVVILSLFISSPPKNERLVDSLAPICAYTLFPVIRIRFSYVTT